MTARLYRQVPGCGLSPDKLAAAFDACERDLREQIRSVRAITSISSPDNAVLLVKFAGGLKVKLCISTVGDYSFDTVTRYADLIDGARFPRVLLQGEGWAAFEWIAGKPVSEVPFSGHIMDGAVRVLGAIHAAKVEVAPDICMTRLSEVRSKLERNTRLLISQGLITPAQCALVSELQDALKPETLKVSLIHGDFSPANVVLCGNELCVVDNDKMRIHITDYDLCRASTFWDEWRPDNQTLRDTYQRQSKLQFDPVSLRFWELYDLIYRISYRISAGAEQNEFCLTKLRQILATGVST